MAAGVGSQEYLGQSLTSRANASSEARLGMKSIASAPARAFSAGGVLLGIGTIVSAPLAVVGGLMASVLYSPKLMSRVLTGISDPVVRKQTKELFAHAKEALTDHAKSYRTTGWRKEARPSDWIQQMLTIEQVLERILATDARSWGDDFRTDAGGPFQSAETDATRQPELITTLSNISPPGTPPE